MSDNDDMRYEGNYRYITEFINKWSRSEYILNLKILSNQKQQSSNEYSIGQKYFLIKIYKNGNVDIKEMNPQNYNKITDILIINDGIKFPKHIINIINSLLLENGLPHPFWPYYNMVFDIIRNYKKDQLTQELITDNEELIKQKEELDKLILYNQQQIEHYKSLEDKIISIEKDKEIILEEKRKIAICKEIMAKNKLEFDNEKLQFEIHKDRINDFDIDKFINSKLN